MAHAGYLMPTYHPQSHQFQLRDSYFRESIEIEIQKVHDRYLSRQLRLNLMSAKKILIGQRITT
jgi:hypothetical protein